MKIQFTMIIGILVVATALLVPSDSLGQADPFWLRSWNEAQTGRPSSMTSSGRIAAAEEPGIPFLVRGQVFGPNGSPRSGVVVHAYHRDRDGFDFGPNDDTLTTWRLQGWVRTDEAGRFEFRTIRPAPDHLGREGAHIHFTLESDEFGRQWAPTVYLADDPLVSSDQRRRSSKAGEFGFVREVEISGGTQSIVVLIRLNESADF
jgi:hypothetical protein